MQRVCRSFFILAAVLFLAGCATGSLLLTGTARPAIKPEQVKIYLEPPASYEVVGMIEASSEMGINRQTSQGYAIDYMKQKAAEVGANGLLITSKGRSGTSSGTFIPTAGGGGFFIGSSDEAVNLTATVIYVPSQ